MATKTNTTTKLPDFGKLFALTTCASSEPCQECEACSSDKGISPRNAFALWFEACQIHSAMTAALAECDDPAELMGWMFDSLPPVCANVDHSWLTRYAGCFDAIATRIAAGEFPAPNSTAEELAMHQILEQLELHIEFAMITGGDHLDYFKDDRPGFQQASAGLPASEHDLNLHRLEDIIFEDTDILMLFSMDTSHVLEGTLEAGRWFDPFYV